MKKGRTKEQAREVVTSEICVHPCSSVVLTDFFKDELPLPIRFSRTLAPFTAWPGGAAAHLSIE
jgi:hypothetical protein